MIYTIVLIAFGIYMGQEYDSIPSVKTLVSSSVEYFKSLSIENTAPTPDQSKTLFETILNILSKK
jgi:hypothetical protein